MTGKKPHCEELHDLALIAKYWSGEDTNFDDVGGTYGTYGTEYKYEVKGKANPLQA